MAPMGETVRLSHVEGVSDSARARELYKYYQPNGPVNTDACISLPTPPEPASTGRTVESPSDEIETTTDINITSEVTSSKVSSPDTALTAFCQLTSWRTGAQRAMISVIDAETQYFIAESTKTVDLVDNTKHAPGDDIWMGCGSVTKAGRLCERTIAVSPTKPGDYPCFFVDDLSKDERFNTLPFVTGPPYLRFYAGVPLITKRGIPIGSLFVVDERVGHGMTTEKIHFMGRMAETIMRHMEMTREIEEHRRGMKMSRGLASFVEGRAELVEADIDTEETEGARIAGQFETEPSLSKGKSRKSRASFASGVGSAASVERKEREYSAELVRVEEAIRKSNAEGNAQDERPDLKSQTNSFGGTSITMSTSSSPNVPDKASTPGDDLSETTSMKMLLSRAANLIREAFEVDGGVVFYDAQTGFSSDSSLTRQPEEPPSQEENSESMQESHESPESHISSDEGVETNEVKFEDDNEADRTSNFSQSHHSPGLGEPTFSRTTTQSKKTVEILAFSTPVAASIHGDYVPGHETFTPFSEKALQTLLRRYPRGKLWTFDADGSAASSSSEDEAFSFNGPKTALQQSDRDRRERRRTVKAKSDGKFIARHFPGVQQLLFVPLWDASRTRWLSGGFAWSTEPTRILSKQSELAFLTAFGNSIMAEWSRIDTEIADQKKGDFIGSISHELRSPLHGILASAEFLEEIADGWQKGLVETIDSCGRTLLDTINHILDYSKINHFEKNWRKTKRGTRPLHTAGSDPLALRQSDLPMLNLFQDVDISVLCEEVVESVFAGHVFQNVTAQSFDMVPDARGRMSDAKKSISSTEPLIGPQHSQHSNVSVILDVDVENYHFTTQPGALRRLIMNLLGNALKYTSHGYVRIKLEASEMEDFQHSGASSSGSENVPRAQVTLTVADTGKGISAEFLRSKLFMPFAQENSLSSGTGLGLSIVRKIVALLEGDITIDSEVGRGTQVRVKLPLLREMPRTADSSNSANTQRSLLTVARESDESITKLRIRMMGKKASLHGFDIPTKDPVIRKMGQVLKESVATFLTKWYGMKIVPQGQKANIVICNESSPTDVQKILQAASSTHKKAPAIIVLCSHNSRFQRNMASDSNVQVGCVAKPVGPLKLAKAIMQTLSGLPEAATPLEGPSGNPPESTDLSSVFEGLTLSPRGGEVLDNSRMASDSDNARKAIESPTPNALIEKAAEFPFTPTPPSLPKSNTMPEEKSKLITLSGQDNPPASKILSSMEQPTTKAATGPRPKVKSPTLLLVDDNHINIRLLSTYLNRRNYEVVHEAQNGLEAVQKFEARGEEGYDIIFMDITMPVLDGFGATRQIRSIEDSRQKHAAAEQPGNRRKSIVSFRPPALIIAFTGRSSIEDQAEAVRVGIDLFMTKPVAFKEVGKIIDNWVANKERERRGSSSAETYHSVEGASGAGKSIATGTRSDESK